MMKLLKYKISLLILSIGILTAVVFVMLPRNATKGLRRAIRRQYLVLTGGLVDVGGYRLRIQCQGTGSPTILMDSGLNMPMSSWDNVPDELAKFTRVCIYERAGVGESDAAPEKIRTSKDAVADLNKLLNNAGEKSPFILVGHSFGGLNMILFSSLYPGEMAGLVLVDSSHPDQYQRYADLQSGEEREKYLSHEGGKNAEGINLLESAKEIKSAPQLPSIPLLVLSAENENPAADEVIFMKDHHELQTDLVKLSPQGKLVIVKDSGHFIQKDRPDVVIEAVKTVYEKSK